MTGGGGLRWAIGPDTDPNAWILSLQGDVIYTSYTDTLYMRSREALFTALTLDATFN